MVVCDTCDYTIATTAAVRHALLLRRSRQGAPALEPSNPPVLENAAARICQDEA